MILNDYNIKKLHKQLIIEGYRPENVGPISYDVTVDYIIVKAEEGNRDTREEFCLEPMCTVFVKTVEKIAVPKNMAVRVVERNSMMRRGLFVSGPHYQPGHITYMFLRVKNLSDRDIYIKKGEGIAQIEFERFSHDVDKAYDQKYQNESEFIGYADPGTTSKMIWDIKDNVRNLNDKLKKTESRIYTNILTLMGIFVAIFSLIIIDISVLINENIWNIIALNSSLCIALTLLFTLISIIIGDIEYRKLIILGIIIVLLIGVLIIAA